TSVGSGSSQFSPPMRSSGMQTRRAEHSATPVSKSTWKALVDPAVHAWAPASSEHWAWLATVTEALSSIDCPTSSESGVGGSLRPSAVRKAAPQEDGHQQTQ